MDIIVNRLKMIYPSLPVAGVGKVILIQCLRLPHLPLRDRELTKGAKMFSGEWWSPGADHGTISEQRGDTTLMV